MNVVKFDFADRNKWDDFCAENTLAWFWHTSWRLEHALNCSFSITSENHSFYIENGGEVLAIVPLTVDHYLHAEGNQAVRIEMTYGGNKTPCPVVSNKLKEDKSIKLYKRIFKEIDDIALTNSVQRLVVSMPLTLTYCKKNYCYNKLLRYGFTDLSLNTSIIDLSGSESGLLSNMYKGHKLSIKKGEKHFKVLIVDSSNITEAIFEDFKSFYFKTAGHVTRPEKVFQLLYSYLQNNMAVMGIAFYDEKPVGYMVTIIYLNDAYYLMGANEKVQKNYPVTHVIQWEIIKYLRNKGINHYELGVQQFAPLIQDIPSDKDMSISRFKRGFGGVTIPFFIGEKIYDEKLFVETWTRRTMKLRTSLYQKEEVK